jgi:hypothetical protein
MKELTKTTVSISDTNQIGIPFGKSYWLATPKFWRKLGDSLIVIGSTVTGISAFTMPPIVTAIAAIAAGLGKIITNCVSEK